jgi:hypothetical protein
MHFSTEPIIFHYIWEYYAVIFCTMQMQQKNMVEPNLDQTEEVDAVEAFKTWHTSTKRGLSDLAREALVSAKTLCPVAN